jgi:predicted N-acetyltransferase YhbS
MTLKSPRIERVKLKDLPAMAARYIDGAAPGTYIPITKHRAAAMVRNPNADPDDVAMLLATQGDRCVGYFGVMAVVLQHDGKLNKVHWLTTWSVAPEFIGKGLGSRLMEEALALDVDLAIVGSKPARRVSAKYGFQETKPLEYAQLDLRVAGRFNPVVLSLRLTRKMLALAGIKFNTEPIFQPLESFFEKMFGWLTRPIMLALAQSSVARALDGSQVRETDMVSGENGLRQPTGFFRSSEVINWMLQNSWVLPEGESTSRELTYLFSHQRPGFRVFAWSVLAKGFDGFIVFQVSRVREALVLKVLDYKVTNEKILLALALKAATQTNATLIEGPAELAHPLEGSLLSKLLVLWRQRTLQLHPHAPDSPLAQALPHLRQTYVDGDTAFT